jgi:hypothetical protein
VHHRVGHYAFVGGVLIAVIAGLLQTTSTFFAFSILLLGIVVGFLNVSAKEVTPFLVAAVALMLAGSADFQILNVIFNPLGTVLTSLFSFIKLFVAPAALVVALKSIISLARD